MKKGSKKKVVSDNNYDFVDLITKSKERKERADVLGKKLAHSQSLDVDENLELQRDDSLRVLAHEVAIYEGLRIRKIQKYVYLKRKSITKLQLISTLTFITGIVMFGVILYGIADLPPIFGHISLLFSGIGIASLTFASDKKYELDEINRKLNK